MSHAERVLTAVDFGKSDRTPVWDAYHFPGFVENWRRWKGVGAETTPRDHYGMDVAICMGDESFFPSRQGHVRNEGDYGIWRDGWGRTIRVGKKDSYFDQTLDSLLDDTSNLDRLTFEPASLETRYDGLAERVAAEREAGRCVFAKIGGIYVRGHFARGEERLLVDMALDPPFCDELFDRVARHFTDMAIETLRRTDAWETGLFVYDDMAGLNGPMFSPAMFERYFLPRYKKMIEEIRLAGCKRFFLHSDGDIRPVMDMLLDAGFQGFHPLEPRAGIDPVKLREKYGRRAVFFGGVCNTLVLPGGDRAEIRRRIGPLVELARDGGYVVGTASIFDDISPEAYDFYMSLVGRPLKD
ncbi:MAG: uroporphyrinogen decarboxylase family protein [Armatimonadota bacterium]|nr:uroporphyrinogen decarboxylase family protein [Armatimonadota bacterium]